MKHPLIVGLAGGSGSGKTTLATGLRDLTARFGSLVISQDDYYLGLPEGVAPAQYNFDEPAALDLERLADDLAELKAGQAARLPLYDFARHRRSSEVKEIAPVPLIIVEGLFIFVPETLRAVFDLRFFVDVPAEERLRRRLSRDARERGRAPEDIREQWERQVEPMFVKHALPTRRYADFVMEIPHPDDRIYCEQVVAMWKSIEDRLR
jgi:uridine kinase